MTPDKADTIPQSRNAPMQPGEAVPRRRLRKPANETRSDILDKAEALFRSRGYAAVAIADVAAALEMSPANVFKHFHTKTNLIDAIATRHVAALVDRLDAITDHGAAPDRLRGMVRTLMQAHIRDLKQNPYLFELVLLSADLELTCGDQYKDMMIDRIGTIIEKGCQEGSYQVGDIPRAARSTFYALASVLHPVMIAKEPADILATRCDEIVDLLNAALQGALVK